MLFEQIDAVDQNVDGVKVRWGMAHRPLWEAMDRLPLNAKLKWIDRLSSFDSIACEWAMVKALETNLKIKVTMRAQHIRGLLAELQRMLWGYEYMHQIFSAVEDVTRVEQALRLREYVFQGQEIFTGSRVLPQAFAVGGVRRDFSFGDIRKFKDLLKNIEFEMRVFFKDLLDDSFLAGRLEGVLPLDRDFIAKWNWMGPVGQGSGYGDDFRVTEKYGIYGQVLVKGFVPLRSEATKSGDAMDRLSAVLFQIRQSLNICYHLLISMPEPDEALPQEDFELDDSFRATATVEGASGPVTAIYVGSKVRVWTTSMRVAPILEKVLQGVSVQDLDLAVSSLGFRLEEADLR